jgi:hypothetical protein
MEYVLCLKLYLDLYMREMNVSVDLAGANSSPAKGQC